MGSLQSAPRGSAKPGTGWVSSLAPLCRAESASGIWGEEPTAQSIPEGAYSGIEVRLQKGPFLLPALRTGVPGPKLLFPGLGEGASSRPPGLQTPQGLSFPEMCTALGAWKVGGWAAVVVRAVSELAVPTSPPVPPNKLPAGAEAQNSALRSAQSERNVIALPRGSRRRMQFRKGAAYWSPGATRLAERRS